MAVFRGAFATFSSPSLALLAAGFRGLLLGSSGSSILKLPFLSASILNGWIASAPSKPFDEVALSSDAVVNDAEAFWGIGAARLPVCRTWGRFCANSLREGSGEDEGILKVAKGRGGEDESITRSREAIVTPTDPPLRHAQFERRGRNDSVDNVAHIPTSLWWTDPTVKLCCRLEVVDA